MLTRIDFFLMGDLTDIDRVIQYLRKMASGKGLAARNLVPRLPALGHVAQLTRRRF